VRARPCCRQAALLSMVRGFREGVKLRGRASHGADFPHVYPKQENLTAFPSRRAAWPSSPALAMANPALARVRGLCAKPDCVASRIGAESQAAGRSNGNGARTRPTNRGSEAPQARKFARAAVRLRMPLGPPRTTSASTSSCPSSCHQQTGHRSKIPGALSVRLPQQRQRTFVICIPGLQSKHRRLPTQPFAPHSSTKERLHRTARTASPYLRFAYKTTTAARSCTKLP
jgi:hypothetical protein